MSGRHVGRVDAEDARADEAVQVLAGVERLDEPGVAREVRHDAHLDLRVVGGQQRLEPGAVPERRADAATLGLADRDVLQVRVVRRHAAGGRAGLPVGRVDAPVGADRLVEGLDDLAELRRVPVLEQVAEERVRVRLLQVGEGARVGRVAGLGRAGLRHAELVEEHLLQLLRASRG